MIVSMFLQLGGRVPMAVQLGSEVVEPAIERGQATRVAGLSLQAGSSANSAPQSALVSKALYSIGRKIF
jgi:hypothetical protein